MARGGRLLLDVVRATFPGDDAAALIAAGNVLVDGVPVTTVRSRVRAGAHVSVRPTRVLRGSVKLRAALDAFGVAVAGRVALDVGAAAGGFTTVLLEAGARRVYAVDAGHGQLLGSLRQDERVINLEAVNVADLDTALIPDPVEVVSIDVSYLSLSAAVAQLDRLSITPGAALVGLVKPMFELRAATAPNDRASLDAALATASSGVTRAGWAVRGWIDSPLPGSRGSRELLLHAVRSPE
ncbi:MAG TPA: SAM-dependent methyltransferase [Candidatus Dormibacteraeota bacterium]|jgi:23S rRNA (cytidine1920-2'-O)/16S rRNA (cytidine1409-2'-O)-methyltransferase|nr:SAM-dependent methyltransferase [Candidatus Dormibacteraeota bacterium]